MSQFLNAINATQTTTENWAKAYSSTLDKNLDFFFSSGASRGKDITGLFIGALVNNADLAIRNLLWLRDVRNGAGERQQFKTLLIELSKQISKEDFKQVVNKIPELGRFDDLECLFGTEYQDLAVSVWKEALEAGNGLAFKWVPVKDKKGAYPLRKAFKMNEASWRKFVVERRKTVEQNMCAKEWDKINFESVPSLAMTRYQKAFHRNCGETFTKYKESLVKGEAKVNVGAVYPYDLLKPLINRDVSDPTVINAQWQALPNYLEGNKDLILPVIDVSGSMYCPAGNNASVQCVDIAISLGLYLAEKNEGTFKDVFMTFSQRPQLLKISGSLSQKVQQIRTADWGGNTDIQKAFKLILSAGLEYNVPQEEMPSKVVIFSDMQFDQAIVNGKSMHIMDMLKAEYEASGYKLPQIVFWQLNARAGGIPVTKNETGCALVSGFSPSIMKNLLAGELEPEKIMIDVLMNERYSWR